MSAARGLMRVLAVRSARKAHPTGDPSFAVMQAFPGEFSTAETDPFLMCDFFDSDINHLAKHEDDFPISWHPHRGMDICTYLRDGTGRHADSLGNRESFATPGMQWISVGSGIEHAEGGGTGPGQRSTGFQIWVNVPARFKMADPKYGTEPPERLPSFDLGDARGTLLAGEHDGQFGPFSTRQPLQMVDYTLQTKGSSVLHPVPVDLDCALLFVYAGSGTVSGQAVQPMAVVRLDASDPSARDILITADDAPLRFMLFAGKRIQESVAWQGPFVMNTDAEIRETIREYRSGQFPPKRVAWDYKRLADFPADHPARTQSHSTPAGEL